MSAALLGVSGLTTSVRAVRDSGVWRDGGPVRAEGSEIRQEQGDAMSLSILLFDGVEMTDYAQPYDVFAVARPAGTTPANAPPLFRIFTVSEREIVTCDGGMRVVSDYRLEEHPPIELILVPGGPGIRHEENNAALID
jgi:putative intracellular protease/amidase